MSNLKPEQRYTLEEYYALDKGSDRRWEYWEGEIDCMSGGSKEHAMIQGNVFKHLSHRLPDRCRVFSSDMAVKTNTAAGYAYPDLSAACNPKYEKHEVQGIDLLINPSVIIEVTSPTSLLRDHNLKKKAYQAIEPLRDCIVVEAENMFVTHYARGAKQWKKHIYDEPEERIEIASVGVSLTLAEIYQGIEFE